MSKFRTAYDYKLEDTHVSSGSPERDVYIDAIDDNGCACIKVSGVENVQDQIEAAKEGTLIYNILESFDNGQLLNQRLGFYGDITNLPTNIHEAYSMVNSAKEEFYKLPKDIRLKFHNSVDEFLSSAGSPEFFANFVQNDISGSSDPSSSVSKNDEKKGDVE